MNISKRCILSAVLSGDSRQQLARPVRPDSNADELCGVFKGEKAGADPAAGSSGARQDALPIVHMDLVGRRRRTLGILSFVIAVPRGTIPLQWTLRPGQCVEPQCVESRRQCGYLPRRSLPDLDIGNALRAMSIEDQDRFKFQMSRVLSIIRLLETRCQGSREKSSSSPVLKKLWF